MQIKKDSPFENGLFLNIKEEMKTYANRMYEKIIRGNENKAITI